MLDLVLAIAHHLAIFALFGVIAAELILVRRGMTGDAVARVAKIDLSYGGLAVVIIVVGFCRAVFAAKGWAYYSHNGFFWAKMAAFAIVGLLSIAPTVKFIRWRKTGASPSDQDIQSVRRFLYAEVAFFALLPMFAAAMARGYGEFH